MEMTSRIQQIYFRFWRLRVNRIDPHIKKLSNKLNSEKIWNLELIESWLKVDV
jgi:hypothetical protein